MNNRRRYLFCMSSAISSLSRQRDERIKGVTMKRFFCILLLIIMVTSICATSLSAEEPPQHDHILVRSCSHHYFYAQYVNCPWQGHYGGGEMHTAYCQIHQTWRFTTVECSVYGCGYKIIDDPNEKHLCDAYHTGANMVVHPCPY